jgi:hypothetical protein
MQSLSASRLPMLRVSCDHPLTFGKLGLNLLARQVVDVYRSLRPRRSEGKTKRRSECIYYRPERTPESVGKRFATRREGPCIMMRSTTKRRALESYYAKAQCGSDDALRHHGLGNLEKSCSIRPCRHQATLKTCWQRANFPGTRARQHDTGRDRASMHSDMEEEKKRVGWRRGRIRLLN